MKVLRSLMVAGALAGVSVQASAQRNVMFTTQGTFSGAGCTAFNAAFSSCTVGSGASAVTLSYMSVSQETSGGTVSFSSFSTSGGTDLGTGFQLFENINFALDINQTSPSVGSQMLEAMISGQVRAVSGGLEWSPVTPRFFAIGNVSYEILVDNAGTNGIAIGAPGTAGGASFPQAIRGNVRVAEVTVPEPSSTLLPVGGMAAMGKVARRRSSAA